MMKVTLRDQILSDLKEYFDIADEILGETKEALTYEDYLRLIAIVAEHTRWAVDYYTDSKEAEVKPV
jgi:hypothetical protein